ncbi:TetR/AcrR family transcriptional regulator [Halobacillus sp. Marseille-Q1614]|uniref:TetR/AcrR family transcriptional regulator n=1 Tax=Halobacillus sp. Marseille-Q1614 TaxID=2709134 RepID=UPI00156D4932|nr:TetR/AcrR family transcriptional regulator [Halobacillus sp. Marseille-Q1614]
MNNLREKIIETSLRLFEQYGFHGVTVKQIVEASKTSKGGFYHHFHSKEELLFVIHDAFITYVSKEARAAMAIHSSPVYQIQAIIRSFVKVFDLYKPHISVFYQESIYLKPAYEKQIKRKRDEFKQMVLQVIEEGQTTGHFRKEVPPILVTMSILGMVNWIYKWYDPDGEFSIDEIADAYIDLVLHSLLTTGNEAHYQEQMLKVPFFYN